MLICTARFHNSTLMKAVPFWQQHVKCMMICNDSLDDGHKSQSFPSSGAAEHTLRFLYGVYKVAKMKTIYVALK